MVSLHVELGDLRCASLWYLRKPQKHGDPSHVWYPSLLMVIYTKMALAGFQISILSHQVMKPRRLRGIRRCCLTESGLWDCKSLRRKQHCWGETFGGSVFKRFSTQKLCSRQGHKLDLALVAELDSAPTRKHCLESLSLLAQSQIWSLGQSFWSESQLWYLVFGICMAWARDKLLCPGFLICKFQLKIIDNASYKCTRDFNVLATVFTLQRLSWQLLDPCTSLRTM